MRESFLLRSVDSGDAVQAATFYTQEQIPTDPIGSLLWQLGPSLRRRLLEIATPDSCILSTRAAILLARRLRIRAFPLVTRVVVLNQVMCLRAGQQGHWPSCREEAEQWRQECGAWSVGLGFGLDPAPDRWPGHLVAMVDRRWLWDISIDQVNRPRYDLHFSAPVLAQVNEDFLRGRSVLAGIVGRNALYYEAILGERGYENTPDWWRRDARLNDAIAQTARLVIAQNSARGDA